MKKFLKKVMKIMFITICILLILLFITVGIFSTLRIINSNKYKVDLSKGIQEDIYVEIGGIKQFMQIRGNDKNNPVVLWLHGGPGFPLTYMNYYYQQNLEMDFTIVYLEQRGCGRTYYENGSSTNASFDMLISDIDEVVEYLKERFDKDKVIIMAQSWGTVLGMKYMEMHPENVSAYVGIGQVTQFAEGKVYSAEKALQQAEKQGNSEDTKRLEMLISEFEKAENIEMVKIKELEEMIVFSSKYLKSKGEMSSLKQMKTAMTSPHININDIKWFLFASNTNNIVATQKELMDYMYFEFDIYDVELSDNIPLYFIQGDCDYITPTDMVQTYYNTIGTEAKDMIIIEDAGHTPFLDNPEKFCEIIKSCFS